MNNLYTVIENFTNGYKEETLMIIFFSSILCSVFVILSKNPIVSVLFLIGLFLNIACYLAALDISFIALSYLLVYVGAVSILFLFILMLINIRVSELTSDTSNSIPLAIMVSFIFYYVIYNIIPHDSNNSEFNSLKELLYISNSNDNNEQVLFTTSESWDNNLTDTSHISTLGNVMYTNYFIWLILSSIILLLAMIGAIIITIKQTTNKTNS